MYVNIVSCKCMSCHKAIVVITGRAYCHNYIYIASYIYMLTYVTLPILLL